MNRWFPLALASTLVLSACAQTPSLMGQAPMPADGAEAPMPDTEVMAVDYQLMPTRGYAIASTTAATTLTVDRVTASTEDGAHFQTTHVTDGNLNSAWSPAAGDTAPTLTFSLKEASRLAGVSIKMSHSNVTIDLAVRTDGGEWKTVATGLAPVPTTLSELELADCQGDEVRLTFRGEEVADLLVCEVQFQGQAGAPAQQPTPVPSTPPTSQEPCVTTGGGWLPVVDKKGKHKVTFAFVAEGKGDDCRGTIVVEDLTMRVKYQGTVKTLVRKGNLVTFTGTLENGTAFTCTVIDAERHNRRDAFSFTTANGVLFCGYLAKKEHHGGRIKVKHATMVQFDSEAEARAMLEAYGMTLVKTHERLDIDMTAFNDRCAREADHDDQAIGRHHKKAKKHRKDRND